MLHFAHIAPTPHLDDFCGNMTHHLLLAHLVEKDSTYATWYRDLAPGHTKILDNSAFEMYKANLPMYSPDKLLDMGAAVDANYIVMTDYPGEAGAKTIKAAQELAPKFKNAGYGTFFVPQSEIGDIEDYIACFAWAACSPLVDYIGVSILGVPNAYGVEKNNKLQRYMSRYTMMKELDRRGLLRLAAAHGKKIHFLGMVDGPNEIELCADYYHIDTWDSSAAVWAGLNGIEFDNTPTGMVDGKFEKEVDFNFSTTNRSLTGAAKRNQQFINKLVERANSL